LTDWAATVLGLHRFAVCLTLVMVFDIFLSHCLEGQAIMQVSRNSLTPALFAGGMRFAPIGYRLRVPYAAIAGSPRGAKQGILVAALMPLSF